MSIKNYTFIKLIGYTQDFLSQQKVCRTVLVENSSLEKLKAQLAELLKGGAEATKAYINSLLNIKKALSESLKERVEAAEKDSPAKSMMGTVENSSVETVKAQNEISRESINEARTHQMEKNRVDGVLREEKVKQKLETQYPESEGYKIHKEVYLRDKDGNILKDPKTGEARRVDFMVEKNGQIVKSVEVTSETAPKESQRTKENRIRNEGGNYIKDKDTGKLIEIPQQVHTEVWRYA